VTRTYRLILEYDGADFAGWQVQPGAQRTVQGTLEEALARVTGERVRVIGAGRTDAGVHALAQVASVRLDTGLAPERLHAALNGVLPEDVAVLDVAVMPDDFHAQYSARSKLYRYRVWNGPTRAPLLRARTLCLSRPLDLAAMREAACDLVGTHDFAAFQAAGSSAQTSIRTLSRLEVAGEAGAAVELWVEGSGFLRHMVRNLAGTLIEVGTGRRAATSMPTLLASRSRALAGPTAPARALSLVRVDY
jgi:tRNA pseudouridine38-40 synthase